MPTVDSNVLRFIFAGLNTSFREAYLAIKDSDVMESITTVVPTNLKHQDFANLQNVGLPSVWQGNRQEKIINQYFPTYTISSVKYENTVAISREAVEDTSQYGTIWEQGKDLARQLARQKEYLSVIQLALGFSVPGQDAAASSFFSSSHAESGSNQSNTSSAALSSTALATAYSTMRLYTDNTGIPMGINPDTLVVSPENELLATQLLHSAMITSGNTGTYGLGNINPFGNGRFKLLVSDMLSGAYAGYWFLMDTSRSVKPVIMCPRTDVPDEFVARVNPEDSAVFDLDLYKVGTRNRVGFGYGLWQTCYGSTG